MSLKDGGKNDKVTEIKFGRWDVTNAVEVFIVLIIVLLACLVLVFRGEIVKGLLKRRLSRYERRESWKGRVGFYLCGDSGMSEAIRSQLQSFGIAAFSIDEEIALNILEGGKWKTAIMRGRDLDLVVIGSYDIGFSEVGYFRNSHRLRLGFYWWNGAPAPPIRTWLKMKDGEEAVRLRLSEKAAYLIAKSLAGVLGKSPPDPGFTHDPSI